MQPGDSVLSHPDTLVLEMGKMQVPVPLEESLQHSS